MRSGLNMTEILSRQEQYEKDVKDSDLRRRIADDYFEYEVINGFFREDLLESDLINSGFPRENNFSLPFESDNPELDTDSDND